MSYYSLDVFRKYKQLKNAKRMRTSVWKKERKKFTNIPENQGVYVFWSLDEVLYVGRTDGRRGGLKHLGLRHRVRTHARGAKSKWGINIWEKGITVSWIEERGKRKRAFIEALTIGRLCPIFQYPAH